MRSLQMFMVLLSEWTMKFTTGVEFFFDVCTEPSIRAPH